MRLTYKRFEPLPPYSGFKSRIKERQRYESQKYSKGCFSNGAFYFATKFFSNGTFYFVAKFLDQMPLIEWLQFDGQKPRFALRQKIL